VQLPDTTPERAGDQTPVSAGGTPGESFAGGRVEVAADWLIARLARPRVRLALLAGALLLTGALVLGNSVWTLPLVIAGALMALVAWIGPRLRGQLVLEWGAEGTQVQFRAQIAPASPAQAARAPEERGAQRPEHTPGEVVEGEAHTIEIEVAELEALIAAAEAEGAGPARKLAPGAFRALS
jgi:hypothetical protein